MDTRTQHDYFEAALGLLAEGGAKVVTIAKLCGRLDVTKGSFYHHFASGPDFMQQLLVYWEEHYGHELVARALAVADPGERIEVMKEMAVHLQHDAESAIRALARTDPFAAKVQRRMDADRVDVVQRTLEEAGFAPDVAEIKARAAVAILVGTQQLGLRNVGRHVREGLEDYEAWLYSELAAVS